MPHRPPARRQRAELTPEQRSLRARMGGLAVHAQGKTNTAPARAKFAERFEREVDPDGILPPDERARRAESARKAYFAELAYRSSVARSKAKRYAAEAAAAEAELEQEGGDDGQAA